MITGEFQETNALKAVMEDDDESLLSILSDMSRHELMSLSTACWKLDREIREEILRRREQEAMTKRGGTP